MNASTRHTIYTQVQPFYTDLLQAIPTAQERISMMYFTFDHGFWAERFAGALLDRAAAGVQVRLMVDAFGLALDAPRNTFRNLALLEDLRAGGVRVQLFRPEGHRLSASHRLHMKVCALDGHTAFIGGSNIGDHYLDWQDTNLRMAGELGDSLRGELEEH
jgi:cardiolipin synthase